MKYDSAPLKILAKELFEHHSLVVRSDGLGCKVTCPTCGGSLAALQGSVQLFGDCGAA